MTSTPVKKLAALAAIVLGAALAVAPAGAQTKTGTAMGQFLLIEPSARVSGMGNAGVALARGLDGVYYNPAAIGEVSRWGVVLTHSAWIADIAYDYVAFAIPAGRWGSVYTTVTALNSGEIDVRTVERPFGTGERYSVSDVAIGVGYGRQFTDRFSGGVQVSYVQETIWHSSARTMTLGVGTLYRVSDDGLHIGASLANFGTGAGYDGRDLRITYDNDPTRSGDNSTLPAEIFTGDFPVPALFRLGVGMPFQVSRDLRLAFEVDAFHPSDNSESMSFGGEMLVSRRLALRAGYQNLFQQDAELGFTLGAGVWGEQASFGYHLDYAWADQGRLGSTHRFTLGFSF